MNITLPDGINTAEQRDWRKLADITASAFSEDPVNKWIFGDEPAIRACFRVLAKHIYSRHGICHLSGDHGAAMWIASDQIKGLSLPAQLSLALGLARHGTKGSLKRAIRAGEIMDENHPTTPHMYLFTIGITKAARGSGKGHALITPMLEACDKAGIPCYLENSNPDNFGFYSAHGFEHMKHFNAGEGGPPLQAMWRDARPAAG